MTDNPMNTKKILVLGADGMAGHIVSMYLNEVGYDVFTTTRKADDAKNSRFDVLDDYKDLNRIIDTVKPNFVINCIGVLNQFAEENKPGAVLINSFFPHYVDSLSAQHQFKMIHISTDCVFSGERGGYSETDVTDATSFYGKTKSLGEVNNDRNVTFRTSIVGPDMNEKGIGLFNWFIKQESETKGFSGVIWTGVTTLQLAKAIEKSFDMSITGLYHLVNNQKINKFDLLSLFKKYMKKDIAIKEDASYTSDKSLINNRKGFDFDIPDYDKMVREMSDWIYGHEKKYESVVVNAKK